MHEAFQVITFSLYSLYPCYHDFPAVDSDRFTEKMAALDRDNDSSAYIILYRSGYEYSVSSFTVIKKSSHLGFPIFIYFEFWKTLWFLVQIE